MQTLAFLNMVGSKDVDLAVCRKRELFRILKQPNEKDKIKSMDDQKKILKEYMEKLMNVKNE